MCIVSSQACFKILESLSWNVTSLTSAAWTDASNVEPCVVVANDWRTSTSKSTSDHIHKLWRAKGFWNVWKKITSTKLSEMRQFPILSFTCMLYDPQLERRYPRDKDDISPFQSRLVNLFTRSQLLRIICAKWRPPRLSHSCEFRVWELTFEARSLLSTIIDYPRYLDLQWPKISLICHRIAIPWMTDSDGRYFHCIGLLWRCLSHLGLLSLNWFLTYMASLRTDLTSTTIEVLAYSDWRNLRWWAIPLWSAKKIALKLHANLMVSMISAADKIYSSPRERAYRKFIKPQTYSGEVSAISVDCSRRITNPTFNKGNRSNRH